MVPSDCSLTFAGFLTGVARVLQLLLPALAVVRITLGFRGEWLTMMANVASEGRLFSLKDSEWFVPLASVAFCGGFLTLIFYPTAATVKLVPTVALAL